MLEKKAEIVQCNTSRIHIYLHIFIYNITQYMCVYFIHKYKRYSICDINLHKDTS